VVHDIDCNSRRGSFAGRAPDRILREFDDTHV
jgi:hypothetical protein